MEVKKRENKLLINNIDPDGNKIIIKYGKDLENINKELLTVIDNTGIWMQEKENVVHRIKKSIVSSITTVDAVDHILSKEEDCEECSVELLDDYRMKIHIPDSKVESIEGNYIQVTVKNGPILSNDEVKTESVSEAVLWNKNGKKEVKANNSKLEKNKNIEKTSIFKEEDRICGDDRIGTAVKLSKKTHRFRSKSALIVNKDKFSDALVSIPLAHQLDAPILFTGSRDLPEATLEEIERLKVKDVYLVGSNQSISKSVESILSSKVEKISRFAGDDRYDTARLLAEKVRRSGNKNTILIASGENFSDALSISSVATKKDAAILLSKKDDLSKSTKKAIASWKPLQVIIAGGEQSVSNIVKFDIKYGFDTGIEHLSNEVYKGAREIRRLCGKNRYESSVEIAKYQYPNATLGIYVSGNNFADSISAGTYAASRDLPILLIKKDKLDDSIEDYVKSSNMRRFTVIGGEESVSNRLIKYLKEELKLA